MLFKRIKIRSYEIGLYFRDGEFKGLLSEGSHWLSYWIGARDVRVEIVDARGVRFEHQDLKVITRTQGAKALLDICTVNRNCAGVLYIDGRYVDTLEPGLCAFWQNAADAKLVEVDLREATADVNGQEIMTADKVSLRMNAVVTYRIIDATRPLVRRTTPVRRCTARRSWRCAPSSAQGSWMRFWPTRTRLLKRSSRQSVAAQASWVWKS